MFVPKAVSVLWHTYNQCLWWRKTCSVISMLSLQFWLLAVCGQGPPDPHALWDWTEPSCPRGSQYMQDAAQGLELSAWVWSRNWSTLDVGEIKERLRRDCCSEKAWPQGINLWKTGLCLCSEWPALFSGKHNFQKCFLCRVVCFLTCI